MNDDKDFFAINSMEAGDLISDDAVPISGTLEDVLAKYLNDFTIEDDTVIGYINEFDTFKEIMEKLKIQGFPYSVRDSDVREKQRIKLKKNSEGKQNSSGKKQDLLPHITVFFQLRAMPIRFFGLPFTIEKTTHYQCAYGCKYYKSKAGYNKKKNQDGSVELKPVKQKKKVGSKKMGCLAKLTIKHITVYPQYELYVENDWRKKKMLIENLRKDLSDVEKTVERFQRFYLSVSVQSSHNHPPIIIVPKPKLQKRKPPIKPNVKSNKRKKLKDDGDSIKGNNVEEDREWSCEELATSSLSSNQEKTENSRIHDLEDDDEDVFNSLVKFPNSQPTAYEQVDYKPNRIEIAMSPYCQNENTQTIEVYEYQPTTQDLQTLFKEKLKRLYTLCTKCSNASLLLRLAIDLEQIEVQLSNDVGYTEE